MLNDYFVHIADSKRVHEIWVEDYSEGYPYHPSIKAIHVEDIYAQANAWNQQCGKWRKAIGLFMKQTSFYCVFLEVFQQIMTGIFFITGFGVIWKLVVVWM